MSGHRPFSELTKCFTAELWQRVAEERAELDKISLLYVPPSEKDRMRKKIISSAACYRIGQSSRHLKPKSRQAKRHALRAQPITALVTQGLALYKGHEFNHQRHTSDGLKLPLS